MTSSRKVKIGPFVIRPHKRDGEKSGSWQMDVPAEYSPTGKRKRRSFATKGEAETVARALLRQNQLQGKAGLLGNPKLGVSFEELSRLWLEEQKERVATLKKRQSSLETGAYQLRSLLSHMRNIDTASITSETVSKYQRARLEEGRRPPTINSEVRLLVQIFRWGLDKRLCLEVPKVENIPETKRRLELLTIAEAEKLLASFTHNPTRVLVRLIVETGIRSSEAFNLLWDDVDQEYATVFVRPADSFNTKSEEGQRLITVSESMISEMMALERINHLVFPGKEGKVRTDIKKALDTASGKAGLTRDGKPMKVRPHMLRKTHATWQAERNLPETTLQARLGHVPGSRVTREIYIHATSKSQRGAVLEVGAGNAVTKKDDE